MQIRFAEDANYWDTTVHPARSLGEIQELLEGFGATSMIVTQGQAGGRFAWLIRFQWQDRSYHFVFVPLACRRPDQVWSFAKIKRKGSDQAHYQMGRIAVYFVKAILTAAESNPHALFGFLELPGARPGGIPATAGELDVQHLTAALPEMDLRLLEGGDNE